MRSVGLRGTIAAACFLFLILLGVYCVLHLGHGFPFWNKSKFPPLEADTTPVPPAKPQVRSPGDVIQQRTAIQTLAQEAYREGQSAFAKENYAEAIKHFQKAVSHQSDIPMFYLALATSYEALGQWEEAYNMMKKYVKLMFGVPSTPND